MKINGVLQGQFTRENNDSSGWMDDEVTSEQTII